MTESETRLPVLVVDDDEPTQNLLRAVLRRCGYVTEVASNGREAIERLQAAAYAAVVLDVMMPEVGGRAVVEFLATLRAPVPVIICSAAGPAALTGFDPAVVKAIVRKPFDVDQFTAAVMSVTEARSGRPMRVLIVDDDTRARYAIRSFLDDAEVAEVERGDAVAEAVARLRPDVVLLDLILPDTSGEEVLLQLRSDEQTRDVPVVIVTSRALHGHERARLLQDAAAIVYKGDLARDTLRAALARATRAM